MPADPDLIRRCTGEYATVVRELAEQGLTDQQIGERLDRSAEAIRSVRRRHRIEPGEASIPWAARREQLLQLLAEAATLEQIAAACGWADSTTRQAIKRLRRERLASGSR